MKVAIIGAGWAGLAAAVYLTDAGHTVVVFEASHHVGGRARTLPAPYCLPDGTQACLDNGQHILIGAYTHTLAVMRQVGMDPRDCLLDLPMTLRWPDGRGLQFAKLPAPLDALGGILGATGWSLADKCSLLRVSAGWAVKGFVCDARLSVTDLCRSLPPAIMAGLIAPLCVSALNTPPDMACGRTFLRVMHDALLGAPGVSKGSHLLLPRVDLTALFPAAAVQWLQQRGGLVRLGQRVQQIQPPQPFQPIQTTQDAGNAGQWQVQGECFDAVVMATSASDAAEVLVRSAPFAAKTSASAMHDWASIAQSLRFLAIATVYAYSADARLPQPMLALHSQADAPAQFVFDRGQMGGQPGLLALVASACEGDHHTVTQQVLAQARSQLGICLQAVQTVVEKRATFACTPNLVRPPGRIADGLYACGDYVAGPYPATLEGAVISALQAAHHVNNNK